MAFNFISSATQSESLKSSLDAGASRVRSIAQRVALASVPGAAAGTSAFTLGADGASAAPPEKVDVEAEMARLADEQLRFEATAKLLEKTYAALRASIQDSR